MTTTATSNLGIANEAQHICFPGFLCWKGGDADGRDGIKQSE